MYRTDGSSEAQFYAASVPGNFAVGLQMPVYCMFDFVGARLGCDIA